MPDDPSNPASTSDPTAGDAGTSPSPSSSLPSSPASPSSSPASSPSPSAASAPAPSGLVRPPVTTMPSTSPAPAPAKRPPGRRLLIGVGIVLGALLGVWGAWRGLVALAEWGVMQTPTDWDKELGAMAAKEIEGGAHVCTDSRLQAFADAMKDALVGEVKHDPFDFEFKVLREDAVNAFALPGGYVFINSGLLERAEDSSEVAGVLGHEINHALLRHGMKRIGRQLAVSLVVRVFLGGLGGLNTQAAGLAANLGELSFSRGEESEADAAGLPIVADAGFEPEGMIRFFKKLTEEESDVGEGAKTVMRYMSTHPLTEDRISDIRALIKKEHLAPNPDYADRVKTLDAELAAVSHTCDAAGDAGRDAADGDDERGRDRTPGGDGDEAESERAPDRGAEREGGR